MDDDDDDDDESKPATTTPQEKKAPKKRTPLTFQESTLDLRKTQTLLFGKYSRYYTHRVLGTSSPEATPQATKSYHEMSGRMAGSSDSTADSSTLILHSLHRRHGTSEDMSRPMLGQAIGPIDKGYQGAFQGNAKGVW